eukprot:1161906-Pelagomonas_calceolata.AAC.5
MSKAGLWRALGNQFLAQRSFSHSYFRHNSVPCVEDGVVAHIVPVMTRESNFQAGPGLGIVILCRRAGMVPACGKGANKQ